jgi:integrase/recombinase XerD
MPRVIPHPALPLDAWPVEDRLGWMRFVQARGGKRRIGRWPAWKDSTLRGVQASYGRWLSWLGGTDAAELALPPGGRLRPLTVEGYFDELRPRLAKVSIATAFIHVESVTRILSPGYDGKWLRPIVCRLRRDSSSTRRKLERIVPTKELLQLGLDLMENAWVSAPNGQHRQMLEFRDGLAIALLAVRPLRLANFVALKTGESLQFRGQTLWICFEGHETKNGRPLEFLFPHDIRSQYEHYQQFVRPYLALGNGQQGDRAQGMFWLSGTGTPLSRHALYSIIRKRTSERFGQPVNPHLFRDCIATSIANEWSDLIWTIPHLLGHWNSETSEAVYIHSRGVPEQAVFSEHVRNLRQRPRTK